ncbi:hypothetical protein U0070_021923, partial [Myodes glareolus]
ADQNSPLLIPIAVTLSLITRDDSSFTTPADLKLLEWTLKGWGRACKRRYPWRLGEDHLELELEEVTRQNSPGFSIVEKSLARRDEASGYSDVKLGWKQWQFLCSFKQYLEYFMGSELYYFRDFEYQIYKKAHKSPSSSTTGLKGVRRHESGRKREAKALVSPPLHRRSIYYEVQHRGTHPDEQSQSQKPITAKETVKGKVRNKNNPSEARSPNLCIDEDSQQNGSEHFLRQAFQGHLLIIRAGIGKENGRLPFPFESFPALACDFGSHKQSESSTECSKGMLVKGSHGGPQNTTLPLFTFLQFPTESLQLLNLKGA